jgi:CBS domain-containing protein
MAYYAASEGRYRGLVQVKDLQSIERSYWDQQTLLDIVHPFGEITSVSENTSLVEVIQRLEGIQEGIITVLSPSGAVGGVIDRGDIVRTVAKKLNLPVPDTEINRIKMEGNYPTYLQLDALAKTIKPNF